MKRDTIQNIKNNLSAKGANLIRTSLGKTDHPRSISYKGGRKSYTPDIVAEYDNKCDLFSVEHKIKKTQWKDLVSKWILFGLEARRRGGRFYVVVNESNAKKCRDIIASKGLSAHLITI